MKRLKEFVVLGITTCFISMMAMSCGTASLDSPVGFKVDDAYRLTWDAVTNARSYVVEIKNVDGDSKETTSKRTYLSLSNLEEGDYEIRIKAVGDGKDVKDSAWSITYSFHKDYENGCLYTLINNQTEYEVTKVGSASGSFRIEDYYRGKPVTRISESAFRGSGKIEEVVIGNKVTSIGNNAFYNCVRLTSVSIPASVTTIGLAAFQGCTKLTNVNIPDAVTTIENCTFAYCVSLEEVSLPNSIISIGESAFANCTSLKEIDIPDSVKKIDQMAFSENSVLTSVSFGSGLEEIGDKAFYQDFELKEVKFSENSSLEKIGDYAFSSCTSLESVNLPKGLLELGLSSFYNSSALHTVSIPESVNHVGAFSFDATKIYTNAVLNNQSLIYADKWLVSCRNKSELTTITKDTFLEDVVGIADQTFVACENLTRISLPDSIKYVGNYAFYKCPKLNRFLAFGVEKIGEYAFMGCTILSTPLFIDSSNPAFEGNLKTIGDYAFYNCSNVNNSSISDEDSFLPDSVESIGFNAFKNTGLWNNPIEDANGNSIVYAGNWVIGISDQKNAAVELKATTVGIADYAFYKNESIQSVAYANAASKIGKGAFYGCINLRQISLGSGVTKIEEYTFYKCSALFSVNIRTGLKEIGNYAFYRCENLNSIELDASMRLQTIGDYAFYGCANIKQLTFGDTVKSIGKYAFFKCESVTELVIPDTVEEIGERAFGKCVGITSLTIGSGITKIGDYAFTACSSLKEINIPSTVKEVGNYAFYNCKAVENLIIGENVKTIGNYAFYGLGQITELIIPQSVESIGNYAFKGCNGLSSVVVGKNVKKLGLHAFYGCKSMTIYTEMDSISGEWNELWNSSRRPVVWGCQLSEEGYVVSVTVNENTFLNINATNGFMAPEREGYTFSGWAIASGSTEVVYSEGQVIEAPVGTTLYAVWTTAEANE